MKKSELKKIIKEELNNVLNEGASVYARPSSKFKLSPHVQSMPGGTTDMFKTPYLVIWLNGGSPVYIPVKKEPDAKTLQKFANFLATELELAIIATTKFLSEK